MIRADLDSIGKKTEILSLWQHSDGSIDSAHLSRAQQALTDIIPFIERVCRFINQDNVSEAIGRDIREWILKGLDKPPVFSNTVREFKAPLHNERSFFWGPLRLANSGKRRGYFIRSFLSQCDEPPEISILKEQFPHPKNVCRFSHLLWGSNDMIHGNNLVFFPENIANPGGADVQQYALFFFNKYYDLYNDISLKTARAVFSSDHVFESEELSRRETYIARCMWGYLHDFFHHQGERPFDTNVQIKTRRITGVLEEIKVDMKTYLVCHEHDLPYAKEVEEFIILERLLRYPQEPDYKTNFDSGTGLLSLSFFIRMGGVIVVDNELRFTKSFNECVALLVSRIEEIEAISSDEDYIVEANKFVLQFLPIDSDSQRFGVSDEVLNSPIGQMLGKGEFLKNLYDVTALDSDSQEWAKRNLPPPVPESEKI